MRIWIVHQNAYAPPESAGTRHFELARRLIARGHDVLIVATSFYHKSKVETRLYDGESWARETILGVPYLWIKTPAYGNGALGRMWNWAVFMARIWRGTGLSEQAPPDVVVGSSPPLTSAFAARGLARKLRVPFVLEVRDLWPLTLLEVGGHSPRHPVIRGLAAMERSLYRSADRIISLLPAAEEWIRTVAPKAAPVTWIPNGVDLEAMYVSAASTGDATFDVVYAGAHGRANGLASIVDAAALMSGETDADGREIRFHFFGDGPEKGELKARAVRERVTNVHFHDPVPKTDIPGILAEADAFVVTLKHSPLYKYGMSLNKLFEYLAAGRPIVFGGDAVNDPVAEAGAGISVAPEDPRALAEAVRTLAALSGAERQAMCERGRVYARAHHDFDLLAVRFETVLEEARAGSKTDPISRPLARV